MMDRGGDFWVRGSDSTSGSKSQCSSRSISDLSKDILAKILLRLTVKGILVCKSVCKSWHDLISDPEFAKLHFDQAEVCPLLLSSNLLYLVQQEIHDFELKLGLCDRNLSMTDANFKLDSIFQIPPSRGYIVDLCNGLFLLRFPNPTDSDLLSVCNPITGELIYLPKGRKVNSQENLVQYIHGFGFSSTSNEYKVLRIIHSFTSGDTSVEVHVLGTESWKDMGLLTFSIHQSNPTYVNGFLYWSYYYISSPIVSFDFEKECFRSFSVKGVDRLELCDRVRLGELGQELCVSGFLRSGAFHVWVMKDHCDEKVWSHVLSIDMDSYGRQLNGPLRPVKYLNDGSLLMFHCYKKALICADSRKSAVRYLKVCGTKLPFLRAIAFIPSFVSLKHALPNQKANVKVLFDTQRFTELERETRDVHVVEEDLCNLFLDSDSDSDSDSDLDHLPLEDFDSDSDEVGHELYREEIESEDEDQEIDSEDEDQEIDSEDEDREIESQDEDHEIDSEDRDGEIGSEDGDQEFSSNNMGEDQEFDPEKVDSEDRNDNQEFDFEDWDGDLELDSEGGDGEFDQEDSVQSDPENRADEFNPEDEDHEFGLEDVNPELDSEDSDPEDGDWEYDIEDGDYEIDCDFGDEDFDYDDGDQDFVSDYD